MNFFAREDNEDSSSSSSSKGGSNHNEYATVPILVTTMLSRALQKERDEEQREKRGANDGKTKKWKRSHRALLLRRRPSRPSRRRRRRWWWRCHGDCENASQKMKKRVRDREENVSNNAAIKRYPISTSNCTKTVLRRRRVTAPVVHLESLPACYQPPSSPHFAAAPSHNALSAFHLMRRRPQSVRRR